MHRKNPTRRLDKRLWFSLGLFAGLIILHQFLIQPALTLLTTDAPAINLAGRQRMLSQKLAKAALTLVGAEEPASRDASRAELASNSAGLLTPSQASSELSVPALSASVRAARSRARTPIRASST